jgi:AcrR family transcriptional regulator
MTTDSTYSAWDSKRPGADAAFDASVRHEPPPSAIQALIIDASMRHEPPPSAIQARILDAALAEFANYGYHAATTRHIASRAQASIGAVYAHYGSKEELLYQVSLRTYEMIGTEVLRIGALETTVFDRFVQTVYTLVTFHCSEPGPARVALYEARALSDDRWAAIRKWRNVLHVAVVQLIAEIAADRWRSGAAEPHDERTVALAVLGLSIDVARWYSPGGALTPHMVASEYSSLALGMVGAPASLSDVAAAIDQLDDSAAALRWREPLTRGDPRASTRASQPNVGNSYYRRSS